MLGSLIRSSRRRVNIVNVVKLAGLALLSACGGGVTFAAGGQGATGAGGDPAGGNGNGGQVQGGAGGVGGAGAGTIGGAGGTVIGGAGGAGGAGAGTTGGAGGAMGNLCEQACAKADGCGLPACQFGGIDCGSVGSEYDCFSNCILGADCDAINSLATQSPDPALAGCLQGCQGGGGGAGGGGMGGGGMGGAGGGSQMDCGACLQQNDCLPQGCLNSQVCQGWALCAYNCADPQCYADCNTQHPNAAQFFEPFYQCACDSCDADCTYVDACNQPGGM
jgi:hypothetical protein